MAELKWGAGTHPGQIRPQNEDDLFASDGVFVVADGMGGHEAGEVASKLAVERIRDTLEDDHALTAERVVDAITAANGDIFRAAIANPGQSGMGTTVTAIAVIEDPMAGRGAPNIDENDPIDTDPEGNPRTTPVVPMVQPEALVLANVGDSRTYLLRHSRLRRVTIDHSYVQELITTGHITDAEARDHPRRNIITRALGIEPDVKVDWWTLPLVRGDRFVLCSDGLVDEVTDEEITATLLATPDPQDAADELIAKANQAGGRDNVTVVVVDVLDGDDPPDPTQEIDILPTWADERIDDTMPSTLPPPVIGTLADDDLEPTSAVATDDSVATDTASMSRRQRRRARRRDRKAAKRSGGDAADPAAPLLDGQRADDRAAANQAADHQPAEEQPADDRAAANQTVGDQPADDQAADDQAANGVTADDAESTDESQTEKKRPKLIRAIAVFVVLGVLIAGSVVLGAWARRGYFVDFDDDGDVTVYQGRRGGLLWIEPTVETNGPARDRLSEASIDLVDEQPTFSARSEAEEFVTTLELADDPDDPDDAVDQDDTDAAEAPAPSTTDAVPPTNETPTNAPPPPTTEA